MSRPSEPESTTRSPFGAVIAELRDAKRAGRPIAAQGDAAGRPRARTSAPEPDLRLETRVVSQPGQARRLSGTWLWPSSLFLHAAVLLGILFGPLLRADALPPAARGTRAFFVAPAMLPPPPPPPARPVTAVTPRAARPTFRPADTPQLIAAVELPRNVIPETLDIDGHGEPGGEPAGEPGGVEGGIPGGVVGGVIGGLPEPPAPIEPLRVGGEIKEPTKLKHVAPNYPDIAIRANVHGAVVLECTVSPQGRVAAVTVIRGISLLNDAAVAAVKQWVYTPTLRDGVPVPVILTVTVHFGLKSAGATLGHLRPPTA